VHHHGERLYKLARQGKEVEVPPRTVMIHHLEVQDVALPLVTLRVECSKGTYIRTLAQDLGRALGCGAHLAALTRLAVGPFHLTDALSLTDVTEAGSLDRIKAYLIPLGRCLPRLKAVAVDEIQARRLAQGQMLPWPGNNLAPGEKVRVLKGDALVAMATVAFQGKAQFLKPVRVFGSS